MKPAAACAVGFALLLGAVHAQALEFVYSSQPAILYDNAETTAPRIAIVGAGYPLEKISGASGWSRVRDETGTIAWIEDAALGGKRTVLVNATSADVYDKPSDQARVRYRVAHDVLLELISPLEGGWAKIRHASGQEGYIRIRNLWGL